MAQTKRSSPSKPRKPHPKKTTPQGNGVAKGLAVAILLPGFLIGIIALGQYALEQIEPQPRYQFNFHDIVCTPPPGMGAADFLGEVQYHAELPDRFNILAEDLPRRLADAFRRHPWVETVQRVTIDAPKKVTVECVYRMPVLAVRQRDAWRVVDRDGVLLPGSAAIKGLPTYQGNARPPAGPPGSKWGDPDVEAAALQAFINKK